MSQSVQQNPELKFFKDICCMYDDFIDGDHEEFEAWLADPEASHKPDGFTCLNLKELRSCEADDILHLTQGYMLFKAANSTLH